MTTPTRYEIQCPNCGCALVIPANNQEELRVFWENHRSCNACFGCPSCQHTFRGLLGKCSAEVDRWEQVVDIDGSRFDDAQKRLDKLFAVSNEPQYLYRDKDGKIVANTFDEKREVKDDI